MRFNPDIHRRQSIRLPDFDYGSAGAYSVTIVTHGRECVFGDVVDGVMRVNDVGRIVDRVWRALPDRFPAISLDAFVVMPNHIHGIIWIRPVGVGANLAFAPVHDTRGIPSRGDHKDRPYGTLDGSLGRVIQAFKSITTVQNIRTAGMFRPGKLWQRNYWERVIRDESELNRIRQYIIDNPANWETDPERPQ